MRLTLSEIRRMVTQVVQPLTRGQFVSRVKLRATLKDVIPFGGHDGYVDTSPFGLNSNPATKVFGYILNLGGDRLAPIIIAHQHNARPEISQGGSVLYATDSSGDTIKSKVELTPDGFIKIGSSTSAEPLVLGGIFTTFFNVHKHVGNLGIFTGTPIVPMSASEVSAKAFTEL